MKPRKTLTILTLAALFLAPTATLHGDETNRIEIDAKQIGAVISPLLFGHNLEHTRRGIWQGISTEMIANRKFAAMDNGLPMRWNTLAGIGMSVDNQVKYAGKHSVRLVTSTLSAACIAGLGNTGSLRSRRMSQNCPDRHRSEIQGTQKGQARGCSPTC